jgi:amino acid transporter
VESASIAAGGQQPPAGSAAGDKGLKPGAIGYLSNLVISVASVAPAYSLAATLGFIVATEGVGLQSPAVMLVAFIPMLFISAAYKYMNRADPDCGTTFSWVTRAIGPRSGWLGGWAIIAADIIVMANLAQIAGKYTFLLFGWDSAASSTADQLIAGVIWIAVMTWICYRGIELSARLQQIILSIEVITLAAFVVVALAAVYINDPAHSIHPAFSWFNPFAVSSPGALVDGVLLGIFIYWGWDSGVAVNEESESSADGPGRAAVLSTILLLLIYVLMTTAAQAYAGTQALADNPDDVLQFLGTKVFPSPLDKLVIITVLTSASASTQTTILPTARTTLSMARWGAIPKVFGRVHERFMTPSVSTIAMGVASVVWFLLVLGFNSSGDILGDSISGLGFAIAFYYGLTGYACVIYYRRELFKSVKNFLFVGLAPLTGALMLTGIFIKAFHDYSQEGFNYSKPFLGIEVPIVIGIGMLLLGVVLLVITMLSPSYREFFRRKPEVAEPGLLEQPVEHARAHL